jgi:four helix bundle protein
MIGMRIQNFEDVISWQKGKELYIEIEAEFKDSATNYSFKDQLFRAAISITNNIAEGFDRGSDKELRQFLIIARGSCAEVRSMLHLASATNKISSEKHKELVRITVDISKLLTGFIQKLATNDKRQETSQ